MCVGKYDYTMLFNLDASSLLLKKQKQYRDIQKSQAVLWSSPFKTQMSIDMVRLGLIYYLTDLRFMGRLLKYNEVALDKGTCQML